MSAWKDYVTAALLGAGKAAPPPLPAQLHAVLADAAAPDDEARFLTQAGALALWRRAGRKPARHAAEIRPSDPETTTPLGRASATHLRAMLSGRCPAVLPEWLAEAGRLALHVPPEFLPALLDRARQDRALRPLVMAANGRRAQWLAVQNSAWAFADADSPELWETGNRDQRVAILRSLRATAPAEARAKIEAVWPTEHADIRAAFVSELIDNLSDDDAPFLDGLLADRSKEVRRAAVDLLARLPASPFVARMIARAVPLLAFKRGGLLARASLEVTLPADPDAAASRDGLDPKAFGQQKTLGEKAVLLVLTLSAVPLAHWTDTFQQVPAALLKAAEKNEFARALATGWAWAAWRQRDVAWAGALLDSALEPHAEFLPAEPLVSVLPEAARAGRLAAALRAGALKKGDNAAWQSFAAQMSTFHGALPAELTREILAALRREAAGGIPWHMRATAESLLLRLPPALLAEAASGWPPGQEGVSALVELLTFRHDALTALKEKT